MPFSVALNVVEPDGTPRMIISSRARFPGSFVRNKEIAQMQATFKQLQASTEAQILKQTSMQSRLFGEMKELRDVGTENQRLEKDIRKLEAER